MTDPNNHQSRRRWLSPIEMWFLLAWGRPHSDSELHVGVVGVQVAGGAVESGAGSSRPGETGGSASCRSASSPRNITCIGRRCARRWRVRSRSEIVQRTLRDGSRASVVNNFVDPEQLIARLHLLSWQCRIDRDGSKWITGHARPRAAGPHNPTSTGHLAEVSMDCRSAHNAARTSHQCSQTPAPIRRSRRSSDHGA